MIHFLKLCYNVFILENKIDARVFRRTCVNLYYILLEIVLICAILERVSFVYKRPNFGVCPCVAVNCLKCAMFYHES
jgi:hypothetical protein